MDQFLNPKSMVTPGVAGSVMMFVANGLCAAFPEFAFRYVALFLSFGLGLLVFAAPSMQLLERGVYWFLNSLIIFVVGVGGSNIGANIAAGGPSQPRAEASVFQGRTSWVTLVPEAHAQFDDREKERERLRAENERLKRKVQEAKAGSKTQQDSGFFHRW